MKVAFIRNPKTGSSSIAAAVPPSVVWEAHEPLKYWGSIDLSFAFVRNPWERLFSWYRHEAYFRKMSFEDYVMTHAMTERYHHGNRTTDMLIADQSEWMEYEGNWPTYIGRFENLEEEYRTIAGLLGFEPGTLGHERINPHAEEYPYARSLWTSEMVDHMAPMFDSFAHQLGYEPPC